jgi:hypothetical protein
MINIHLGMPRIGFRNLGFVERNRHLLRPGANFLVPGAFYKAHMRSSVNASRATLNLLDLSNVQSLMQKWSHFESLSISQPALLGDPRQLLLSPRARRKAATRVKMIRAMFHDQQICFHIQITNQAEYFHRALPNDAEMLLRNSETFSWATFIEEIGLVSPRNSVIVWNCEAEAQFQTTFLERFLNQSKSTAEALFARSIGFRFPDSTTTQRKMMPSITEISNSYEDDYQADLKELGQSEGVSVMGLRSTIIPQRHHGGQA